MIAVDDKGYCWWWWGRKMMRDEDVDNLILWKMIVWLNKRDDADDDLGDDDDYDVDINKKKMIIMMN